MDQRVLILAGAMLAFSAAHVTAEPLHYDPYYTLVGKAKFSSGAVGIDNTDLGSIGDITDVMAMGKFAFSDKLEVGGLVTLGILNEGADSFQSLLLGGKFSMTQRSAATLNVLVPVGGVDDPGISLGYMRTFESGSWIDLDTHAKVGLLDGYTGGTGAVVDVLLELTGPLGERENVIGHVALLNSSNTDDIGDNLAINFWPNVDVKFGQAMINAGVTIGIAGDRNQDELGVKAFAIIYMD